jgi:hypothetical protein
LVPPQGFEPRTNRLSDGLRGTDEVGPSKM